MYLKHISNLKEKRISLSKFESELTVKWYVADIYMCVYVYVSKSAHHYALNKKTERKIQWVPLLEL